LNAQESMRQSNATTAMSVSSRTVRSMPRLKSRESRLVFITSVSSTPLPTTPGKLKRAEGKRLWQCKMSPSRLSGAVWNAISGTVHPGCTT
jgi:hypothetical protein